MHTKQPLEWETQKRRVHDLLPFKHNPRTISEKQRADLVRSIQKFGLVEIPAIDTNDKILAGHQRIAVLQLLGRGKELIDVRVPTRPLTKTEYKEYLLTSNRVHGEWDYDLLAEHFDLDTLLVSGFDDNELSEIFANSLETENDEFDFDGAVKKIKKPITKTGDIYALGPHRLTCGDSLDPSLVKKLIGRSCIDMIYCDPPYNISLDYNKGIGGKASYGGTVDDSKSDFDYRSFLKRTMQNALSVSKQDVHVYYWCDQKYIGMIQGLFAELGLANKRVCMWIKGSANPTPGVAYNKCYEPCVYATRGKPYLSSSSMNFSEVFNKEIASSGNKLLDDILDIIDLWLAKRVNGQTYQHPTQKPVTLHERAIKRSTKPGATILDLFGGSGSTLMASEQMKRTCYMIEAEPVFVDVIIDRYEKATGIKAKKLNAYEKE
jgi:DNA modification methylase